MSVDEISDYYQARNYSIVSLSYVWNKARPEIEKLLSDTEKVLEPSSFFYIKNAYDLLSDGIIQSILEEKERTLKTMDIIKQREVTFFKQIASALPDIFNDLFYAYLENSQYTQRDEHIAKLAIGFAKYNVDLRYPDIASNPPVDKDTGRVNQSWQLGKMDELLECYAGVVSLVQSVRNSVSHIKDTRTKNLLKKLKREIIEPVNYANSSGGIFVLTSIVIVIIHEFREVLQTWLDTIKLGGKP